MDNILDQVNHAINIFECKTNGTTQGLFVFDNAPSHLKRASDAISAQKMVKSLCLILLSLYLADVFPRSKA
jgi:hypothetical protein